MSETIYYRSVNPELFVGQPSHIQTLRIGKQTTVRVGHVVHTVQSDFVQSGFVQSYHAVQGVHVVPVGYGVSVVQNSPIPGIHVVQSVPRGNPPNILHQSFSQQMGGWR